MGTLVLALALRLVVLGLACCAALIPDAIGPEVEHESHLLQHEPFTGHPTNYGRDMVGVDLAWRRVHWTTEIGESYDLGGEGVPGCAASYR